MTTITATNLKAAPKKRGPGTKAERIRRQLDREAAEKEAKDAASKADRYPADTKVTMTVLLAIAGLVGVAGFIVSFSGLFGAAAWAVGDFPALQIAAPGMLDLAIIAVTIKLFVERERGERVRGSWAAITTFALVSAAANVLHALSVSTAKTLPELVVGCVISGGAPFLLAYVVDVAGGLVFRKPKKVSNES